MGIKYREKQTIPEHRQIPSFGGWGWVVLFGIIVFGMFQQSETLRLADFLLIVAGIIVAALIVFGVILVRLYQRPPDELYGYGAIAEANDRAMWRDFLFGFLCVLGLSAIWVFIIVKFRGFATALTDTFRIDWFVETISYNF